ncbi:MAG: hypothetical protein LBH97_06420 [Treponema sp.]|nr:hypothetical protein [Treponema sp.]
MELFQAEGRQALGFGTGLDARSFAQAKLAQLITEPGLIVFPDGAVEIWKPSGVIEREDTGEMVVWGPPVAGARLDLLLEQEQDKALAALVSWIEARLLLDGLQARQQLNGQQAALWPCAVIVTDGSDKYPAGAVFFAPQTLAIRYVHARGAQARLSGGEWYVHPDLEGMDAAAFSAAAMLYRILAGAPPFPAEDELLLHQDIREGNFLPIRFAAPGLDDGIAGLIQSTLSQAEGKGGTANGAAVLGQFLELLRPAGRIIPAASCFRPLSSADILTLETEKEQFRKKNALTVNTKRFVIRNTTIILVCAGAALAIALIAGSAIRSRAALPTTTGMVPVQVIEAYYGAIGDLNHQLMDACVTRGAGKNDISMVINFFVLSRVRMSYEPHSPPLILPAQQWQDSGGGPVDIQIFGVTDLHIEQLGIVDDNEIRFRASYILWIPRQNDEYSAKGVEENYSPYPPQSRYYIDEIFLIRKKGNWRIAEIRRSEK